MQTLTLEQLLSKHFYLHRQEKNLNVFAPLHDVTIKCEGTSQPFKPVCCLVGPLSFSFEKRTGLPYSSPLLLDKTVDVLAQ